MGTCGYRWIESSLSYGSMAAVHSTLAPDLDQTGRSGPNLAKLESRMFHGGDQWCGGHHPDHQRWFGALSRPRPLHQATRGSKNKFKRCVDARARPAACNYSTSAPPRRGFRPVPTTGDLVRPSFVAKTSRARLCAGRHPAPLTELLLLRLSRSCACWSSG